MRPAKSSRSHSRSPMTVQHDPPSDPIPPLQSNVRIRTVNNPLSRASLGCCFDVARVTVSHSTATVNCHCPYVRSDPIRSGVRGRVGKLGGGEGTGEIRFVSIRFDSFRFDSIRVSRLVDCAANDDSRHRGPRDPLFRRSGSPSFRILRRAPALCLPSD